MQVAIYFQLLSGIIYSYEKPLLLDLQQYFPELITFDFDTQSDRWVAGYAMELLEKADKAIIIIEATDDSATGFVAFLENVIHHQDKCLVLLFGHHPFAEQMLSVLEKDRFVQADPDTSLLPQAVNFLSARQA